MGLKTTRQAAGPTAADAVAVGDGGMRTHKVSFIRLGDRTAQRQAAGPW